MASANEKIQCPQCGNRSPKSIFQIADTFKCGRCGGMFDNDPDEGGTHYSDPSKRLERAEDERARRQQRRR